MNTTAATMIAIFGDTMPPPMHIYLQGLTEPAPKRGRPPKVFPTPSAFLASMRDLRGRLLDMGAAFDAEAVAALLNRDGRHQGHVTASHIRRWARQAGFNSFDHLADVLDAETCPGCHRRQPQRVAARNDAGALTRWVITCPCGYAASERA